jgi:hypothetical protein
MYSMLKQMEVEKKYNNIYLCDTPYNKIMYTYSTVVKPQVDNYIYCKKNNIIAKYFIPLASNCYFHKKLTKELIQSYLDQRTPDKKPQNFSTWLWPRILHNKKINTILSDIGVSYFCPYQHEGIILEYDIMDKISDIIISNDFSGKIEYDTSFEEYLFASIYYYLTGYNITSICHVFWNKPQYQPTIADIVVCNKPCVKRVDRKMTNIIRQWQRRLTSNYGQMSL